MNSVIIVARVDLTKQLANNIALHVVLVPTLNLMAHQHVQHVPLDDIKFQQVRHFVFVHHHSSISHLPIVLMIIRRKLM
jgi:hypothetical protein